MDEREWFVLESQKLKKLNDEDESVQPDGNAKKRAKDFIENELRAMSKLSLYDTNEVKLPDDNISTHSSLHVKDDLLKDIYGLNENDRFLASGEHTRENSLHSSMQFDEPEDGEREESVDNKRSNELHFDVGESGDCHDETDYPQNPYGLETEMKNCCSLFFADNERSVDFVLVWKKLIPYDDAQMTAEQRSKEVDEINKKENDRSPKREVYEENLMCEGLEIERTTVEGEITFVKVHAPLEVLRRYAEILKLRMPMKEFLCSERKNATNYPDTKRNLIPKIPGLTNVRTQTQSLFKRFKGSWVYLANKILLDEKNFPPLSHRFTAIYSRDKEYLFDLSQSSFFNANVRSRIVQFILDRQRFSRDDTHDYSFGIDRLVNDGVYIAAYPLHDGDISAKGSRRNLLLSKWATMKKFWKYQPLDYIKDYFGVKIGIYFAWLGFYTYMLILASIAGVASFIYSLKWMRNNPISQQICEGNQTMCPLCDKLCDYWDLKETCLQATVTSLFDNPVTVLFAVFMSFWAALFLEHWKRYSAEITHRWDLTGFDLHEEHPRPLYLARLAKVSRKKTDYVTNTSEPHVPFWRMKLPATLLSVSVVLLLVALAFATVLGVVLYRMSVMASSHLFGDVSTSFIILFSTSTASIINLLLIVVLNYFYEYLAEYLTELELVRTQTEFDDSITLKIYLLQFVNYYASIFYIAFFKGKFIGSPKEYNRFFDFRQEECGLGGCMMELMIQLAIIMIGKQAMNAFIENLFPIVQKHIYKTRLKMGKKRDRSLKGNERYIQDLKLVEFGSRGLFPEYLEMIIQYGFVTIFVAAFPLAPLFALINNIVEVRLDAKKLLAYYRRPVFARVRNIGVWYRILDCISKLSVITNGFIIAFTSDFVPRLVYYYYYSNQTLDGYVEFTLSTFDTSEFKPGTAPLTSEMQNVTECRYQDYRYPSNHTLEYKRTAVFWNVMAARLIFVVIFENAVAIVMILVRWLIPDVSAELKDQIRREAYITNEIIIKQEAIRATRHASKRHYISSNSAWNRLLSNNLSGSQLDLFIQSENETRAKKRLKKNTTQDFINHEAHDSANNKKSGDETNV